MSFANPSTEDIIEQLERLLEITQRHSYRLSLRENMLCDDARAVLGRYYRTKAVLSAAPRATSP